MTLSNLHHGKDRETNKPIPEKRDPDGSLLPSGQSGTPVKFSGVHENKTEGETITMVRTNFDQFIPWNEYGDGATSLTQAQ